MVKENFGPKCFRFLSKKLGRVNPVAGIYAPPPPESSRVKIMELLLVVLKENFCSNKIVRVNPGGRVCDPPPPVISRVKIVFG